MVNHGLYELFDEPLIAIFVSLTDISFLVFVFTMLN